MLHRKAVAAIALLAMFCAGQVAAEQPGSSQAPAFKNRHIIVFALGTTPASQERIVSQAGAKMIKRLNLVNALVVTIPQSFQQVIRELRFSPQVVRVEEDIYTNWLVESDAGKPSRLKEVLGYLGDETPSPEPPPEDPAVPGGIKRVNAPEAWPVAQGSGVKVGVVDTGIDLDHPDLAANIAGWFNAISTATSADDDNGHGTHVAGTIAAVRDSTGVAGVAPKANLYAVKVLDKYGSGYFSDVISGMEWCAENGMAVMNMSLGTGYPNETLEEAVKKVAEAGVIIIAAAGNSGGSVGYPAAYQEAIAISASDSEDTLAYFSSRGPEVEFIAPGVSVYSTYMEGEYRTLSGTSMACPHMVGLVALALQQGIPGTCIRIVLKVAAEPIEGLTEEEQGAGLVNAANLVNILLLAR